MADEDDNQQMGDLLYASDDIAPVKWRRCRDKHYLMIKYRDSEGTVHIEWEFPRREAQIGEMVDTLRQRYEELHHPSFETPKSGCKKQRTLTDMFTEE